MARDTNQAAKLRARRVLPGYPFPPYGMSREQIEEYFAGRRITCLMCGKSYVMLASHLHLIHDMAPDDYRERYGLPFTRGLTAAPEAERRHRHGLALFEQGKTGLIPGQTAGGDALRGKRRRQPQYAIAEQTLRAKTVLRELNAGKTKFAQADYDEVLRRFDAGEPLKTALAGRVDRKAWDKYLRGNPDLAARVEQTCRDRGRERARGLGGRNRGRRFFGRTRFTQADFDKVRGRILAGAQLRPALEGVMSRRPWDDYMRKHPEVKAQLKSRLKALRVERGRELGLNRKGKPSNRWKNHAGARKRFSLA